MARIAISEWRLPFESGERFEERIVMILLECEIIIGRTAASWPAAL